MCFINLLMLSPRPRLVANIARVEVVEKVFFECAPDECLIVLNGAVPVAEHFAFA